jgi:stage V sporulation protein G
MPEQNLTHEDIAALREITPPRKSVMNFSNTDVASTEAFAEKFRQEIGDKSPYQRRLEDWREAESTAVAVVTVEEHNTQSYKKHKKDGTIPRGTFVNQDTGYEIVVGSRGIDNTFAHAQMDATRKTDVSARLSAVYQVDDFIRKSISLDVETSEKGKSKSPNSIFMHKLYAPFIFKEIPYLAKITLEEFYTTNKTEQITDISKRFYNLADITVTPLNALGFQAHPAFSGEKSDSTGFEPRMVINSTVSVAQLFAIVKEFDKNFYTHPDAPGRAERLAEIASQSPHREENTSERSGQTMETMRNQSNYRLSERQKEQAERMAEKWAARAEAFWSAALGESQDGWGIDTAGYCKTPEDAEKAEQNARRIQDSISRLSYGEGTIDDVKIINAAVAGRDELDAVISTVRDMNQSSTPEAAQTALIQNESIPKEDVSMSENRNFPPVYTQSFDYAMEHGEQRLYWDSDTLNGECAKAIDDAIRKNTTYRDMAGVSYVDTKKALAEVTEQYGEERVYGYLASYVQKAKEINPYDGRYGQENKAWAESIEIKADKLNFYLSAHTTVINSLTSNAREAQQQAKTLDQQPTTPETAREITQNTKEAQKVEQTHESGYKANSLQQSDSDIRTGASPGRITARVTPIENDTNLKGVATVMLGDQISVHGVKIVEGKDGLFLSMPGEKGKDGVFNDTVIPASKDAYENLKSTVLNAYNEALTHGKQDRGDLSPSAVDVKVSGFRENTYDNNIKGDCQITVDDVLVIKGVKVIVTKEGELSVAMPSKQSADGDYISVATPASKEFFAQIKEAVLDHYQNRGNIIGNTPYKQLGEELEHKTLNGKFAEKVGAQLDEMGVNWSGKVNGDKTSVAVSKADAPKLEKAMETAKTLAKEAKDPPKIENPVQAGNRGGRR